MADLPDLRDKLGNALRRLSEKEGCTVTMTAAADRLKLHRVDLYRACAGDVEAGFGPSSKRRKRLERFIDNVLKEEG